MGTRDYAQYGTPTWQSWGIAPSPGGHLIIWINDGDDNSYFQLQRIVDGIGESGTWEIKVQIGSRWIQEMKFITEFEGGNVGNGNTYSVGFKLQYWNGSWQTLYTKSLTVGFTEGKTTRNYTNGGSGFENVSLIRIWGEWTGTYDPTPWAHPWWACDAFSLILISEYFPDSGLRFKTNDGQIGIGRDTALGSNKLRFYDGDAIRALPLKAINDRYATKIRIYDGAAIKALTQVVD